MVWQYYHNRGIYNKSKLNKEKLYPRNVWGSLVILSNQTKKSPTVWNMCEPILAAHVVI